MTECCYCFHGILTAYLRALTRRIDRESKRRVIFFMKYYKIYELDNLREEIDGVIYIERWMDIDGYEELYQISDFGRVKRKAGYRATVPRILKTCLSSGYVQSVFCKDAKTKHQYVHILVAKHFIPNPNNYPEVNHLKGIKIDNRFHQLEWVTKSGNQKHRVHVLNGGMPLGESSLSHKLNNNKVAQIRLLGDSGLSYSEISKTIGISRRQVRNIVIRKHWKHI